MPPFGVSAVANLGPQLAPVPARLPPRRRAPGGGAQPFLKWAGGKGRLLPELLARLPASFGAYHEPFVGGGALFIALTGYVVFSGKTKKDPISRVS